MLQLFNALVLNLHSVYMYVFVMSNFGQRSEKRTKHPFICMFLSCLILDREAKNGQNIHLQSSLKMEIG